MRSFPNGRNETIRSYSRKPLLPLLFLGAMSCFPFASAVVNVPAGTILTVAGTGEYRHAGEGEQAAQSPISAPLSVTVDSNGNLFVAEAANSIGWIRIRKVDSAGILTSVAGGGKKSPRSGTEALALETSIGGAFALTSDPAGTIYFSDLSRSMKVTSSGVLTVFAGGGSKGPAEAEGGEAVQATFTQAFSQAVDAAGNLFIADILSNRIFKVTPDGMIYTVAGGGDPPPGSIGDGGPALSASLYWPTGVAVDDHGNLYIADGKNQRIRKVDNQGIITTVAGTGEAGFSGDGGPAILARLKDPLSVQVDVAGNLFIADRSNGRIRKVAPNGTITTIAGGIDLPEGSVGDGGPAVAASLVNPISIALDTAGNLYISDAPAHANGYVPPASNTNPGNRVRKVFSVAAPGLLAGAPFPAGSSPGPGELILGDLNFNGKVETSDATLSLRIAVGSVVATAVQRLAGDMNADGTLDLRDTTFLLRKAVGL